MLDELSRLLFPITPEQFVEKYWEREPLYILGHPDKFRDLFDRAAFDLAVADHEARGISLRASSDRIGGEPGGGVHAPINASQIEDWLARGATVCADPIDRGDPELARFAHAVKKQLGHAGQVTVKAYLSTDGYGFNAHFDRNIATTLQISGRKRWRFSQQPGMPFPPRNALQISDGSVRIVGRPPGPLEAWEEVPPPAADSFREVVLGPGDVLCLPAGTWHEAKAIGHSLALNLAFSPLPFLDLFGRVAERLLQRSPSWRRSVPLRFEHGPGTEGSAAAFSAARLAELRQVLDQLKPDSRELEEAWTRFILEEEEAESPAFTSLQNVLKRLQLLRDADRETSAPHEPERAEPESANMYDGTLTCTLCVRDLEISIAWYEQVLGLRLRYRLDVFGWCELATESKGVTLGLSRNPALAGSRGTTLTLGVRDLEATRRSMEARGVRFDGETQSIPGLVKLAAFLDPDGNRLLLSQSLRA
jgi:ribosomal protein L16 Arg81 hydroxylase/predicted enzyme related to lactoylglutathione lyase